MMSWLASEKMQPENDGFDYPCSICMFDGAPSAP
jgi:hypothetical protein